MTGIAFLLVIMSALLHAAWNFTAKRVSGNLSVLYLGMSGICVVLLPFVLLRASGTIMPHAYPFVIVTGVIHALYFVALSRAYKYGNISTVYPVARGFGVIGTAIVAIAVLSEKVSLTGLCGIISAGFGIFVIGASVEKGIEGRRGLWFAFLVGSTMIGYSVVDKLAMAAIDPVIYIFWMILFSMALLTPYMLIVRRRELIAAWKEHKKYSMAIGLGATAGYLLILFVFRMAQVSYVVAVRELSVVVGSILGVVYLRESLSIRKLLGILMVVAGLVLVRIA
ncbi:MAG: EamA family transporter [candidate division WOR-3 bacterium]|nr:MAG: EamA family transporter [candidate division WOR-3 bacterium]